MPNSHSSILTSFNVLDMLVSNTAANANVTMSVNFVTFASFFWYFLVSVIAMPLTFAPSQRNSAQEDTHRKTDERAQCCLFQRLCLSCSNNRSAMSVDLRPWSISRISSHTFLLALPTPVTYL